MKNRALKQAFALLIVSLPLITMAGIEAFSKGPVFKDFGENAPIEGGLENAKDQHFKVAFDIAKAAEGEAPNRSINSVARFINMHARAGVPVEQIKAVVIVHGPASTEMLSATAYQKRFNKPNPSLALLQALIEHGVEIVLCGQSAVFNDVAVADLMPGVTMSLSAMTAHALYQQQGFTLNPF